MRIKDDVVENWLKEHDPDYGKNKHYLNSRRFRRVLEREIPSHNIGSMGWGGNNGMA